MARKGEGIRRKGERIGEKGGRERDGKGEWENGRPAQGPRRGKRGLWKALGE